MQQIVSEAASTVPAAPAKKMTTSTLPIRAFFVACLRNWYWFLISMIACGCIAFLYSKALPLKYDAKALILLKSKDSNQGTQTQAFSDLGITTGNNFMPNEIYKIRSTDMLENVVKNLGINVQYYGHVFLRDINIYHSSPIDVTPLRDVTEPYSITVVPKGNNDFEFQVSGENGWKKAHFGNKVNTKHGPIAITKNKNYTEQYKDFKVIVRVNLPHTVALRIKSSLVAEQADKISDVMRLSLNWDNNQEAVDILNTLIATYNQQGLDDKNQVARNTESFIAERVEALSQDLSGVDNQVAVLKTHAANQAMYADASTGLRYADNAASVDMQVSLAGYIQDYLSRMSGNELIPSNTGIANTGIEGQITQYNEAMLKYQKIAATSSDENPVMVELNRSLTTQRQNIMRGLNNYISSLRMQQSQAHSQEGMARGGIVAIPSQEKAITEVTRQQKIKEQLYMYLLNKREENALQLAITEPNAKVMERATSSGPNGPYPSQIILVGLLVGLLIPALMLYAVFWYYSLDTNIHSRHDIEDVVNVPIVGELPSKRKSDRDKQIVVTEDGHDRITEAMHIIRANLDYIAKPKDGEGLIIQFTSTMPGEGKSFVAANMALSYAHAGKKVIAVDLDLRKGRFSEYVGIDNYHNGVSNYLSGVSNFEDIIIKGKLHKNLDMLCIGAIPPNPTNLIMSDRFKLMIEELRKHYDYIILDTVPFKVIADAGLINRYVDVTIYVIRSGKVDKRYLSDLERLNDEQKINNLTFLVNDVAYGDKNYGYGSYGYGYGYGYGYHNYGYGYGSYGYEDDEDGENKKNKK